jgi:hypothetical protein
VAALRATHNVPAPAAAPEAPVVAPAAPAPVVTAPAAAQPDMSKLFGEYEARKAAADKAVAEAATKSAEVDAKYKKLSLAKSNPAEFMAELGFTESEWTEFWTTGGKLSPEQQRVREIEKQNVEMRKQFEDFQNQLKQKDQQAALAQEVSNINIVLQEYPLVAKASNPAMVKQEALRISAQEGNRMVTWKEAAESLNTKAKTDLQGWLKDPKIADMLGLSVSKPSTTSAASPSTLGRQTAPTTKSGSEKINPRDWSAKKAAYLAAIKK